MLAEQPRDVGSALIAAGWKQGVLFDAPAVRCYYNCASNEGGSLSVKAKASKQKPARLVLITQTCDIKSKLESRVGAMICTHEKKANLLSHADTNSVRWFLIDPATGLVAHAMSHLQIEKELLTHLKAEPWPSDAKRLERFRRWLARRYDRPALPDALVDNFQVPLERALRLFAEESPDTAKALSEGVHEFRVAMPASEDPPYELKLVLMIRGRISRDQADAIDIAMARVHETLRDYPLVRLNPDEIKVTEDQISVADFYATRPLFLEYLTYKGEDIEGSEPLGRA